MSFGRFFLGRKQNTASAKPKAEHFIENPDADNQRTLRNRLAAKFSGSRRSFTTNP
jgi:hypothetical protein